MKTILICSLILICNISFGKSRDFVTTRLMSTSGAGVGAILLNESSLLNPASIAYFDYSAFYYQKSNSELASEGSERTHFYDEGLEESFIISDTSSAFNGNFSYNHLKENNIRTKRYASSFASPLTENSSIGLLIDYLEVNQVEPKKKSSSDLRTTLGYSLVYGNRFSLGAIYTDAARANKEDQFFIGGFQVEVSDNLHLLLDGGFNPNYAFEKTSLHRFGLQINFISDFYVRLGQFYDKSTNLKGNSWGISWVGPKLSLDYAFRRSELIGNESLFLVKGDELQEHSFALSVRF